MSKYLVTSAVSSSPKATTTGCIVTIFGVAYDVTALRGSHPGGDIFKCGTDMSDSYKSEHGTNVSMLQKYSVNGSSSTGSSQTSSRSDDDDEDHEDRDDDDRDEDDDDDDEWEDEKDEWEHEWEKAKDDDHDEDD